MMNSAKFSGSRFDSRRTTTEVERRLRRWAEAKALPTPHVRKWLALDEAGRARLLDFAESLKMHTGQFITALTLLEEIAVREGQSVGEILDRLPLRRVLDSAGSGPGRARLLLEELRAARYPQIKRASDYLAGQLSAIKLPPCIKVVLPRDLASDEVRVEIVAHGSAEMEQVLASLTAKSPELVRLAAMLAGEDDLVLDVKQ
jgi:hypothetical protein